MAITPRPRRAASGSTVWMKESRCTSAGFKATSTVSKSNRRIASSRIAGIVMARDAEESYAAFAAGL